MLSASAITECLLGVTAMAATAAFAPWLGIRALLPSLHGWRAVSNYRGTRVPLGLGFVWLFWGAALGVAMLLTGRSVFGAPEWFEGSLVVPLVVGAFLFGLIDDVFGTPGHKGFRGHLAALARLRLTTGAVKLFGIGALALVAGAVPAFGTEGVTVASVGRYVASVMLIALAANTVNLFDLRPARALKAYGALIVLGLTGGAAATVVASGSVASGMRESAVLLVAVLGPAVAVWGPDAREQAMLGDAGANAFGMLAGVVLVWSLPGAAVVVAAALLLALNLLSERISFSAVIERVPWLAAIDRWGRPSQS